LAENCQQKSETGDNGAASQTLDERRLLLDDAKMLATVVAAITSGEQMFGFQ
jgi:hypothetical protein